MIKKNDKEIVGVFKGTTEISAVYKGLVLVYQNAKTLIAEGISPLTLLKALDKALLGYRVYGNSTQQLLPDGYTQLEYIESTGTQYINTGIIYSSSKDYIIYQDIQGSGSQNSNKGSGWNAGGALFAQHSSQYWFDGSTGITNVEVTNRAKATIHINTGADSNTDYSWYFVSSGTTFTSSRGHSSLPTYSGNQGYPLLTSTGNTGTISTQYNMSAKLYRATITVDNVLERDLIPCKNSSNVIGMYDTVSGTFFQNAGTGTFTAGPTAPTPNAPIEIQSVGDKTKNLWNSTLIAGCMKFADGQYLNYPGYVCNATPIPVKAGETYTLSADNYTDPDLTSSGFVFYNNGTFVSSLITTSLTVTIPAGVNQLYYDFRHQSSPSQTPTDITNVQLEVGSTATPYEPYGYKIPITVGGKNICDPNSFINTKKLLDGVNGNLNSNNNYKTTDFIFIKSGTYTLSLDNTYDGTSSTTTRMCLYNTNYGYTGNAVSDTSVRPTRPSYTFTVSNDCYYRLSVRNTDINVQLEKSATETAYETYVAPRTTNIYLNQPLRKIGNADAVKLPSGYTQLEYIQSTGTQYIDTGIIPAVNQQVICQFSNLKDINKNSENYVFGHYPNLGGYSKAVRAGAFTGPNYNPYRYSQCEYFDTNGNIISTEIAESDTIIVKTNNPLTLDTNPLASYHIFAQGRKVNNVTTVMAYSKVRLHYFKIIDTTTNEIISNFIPCKNLDNTIGLYDTVTNTFYTNAGTGTFTAGPEIYVDYIDFETQKVYRNVKKINLSTTLSNFSFYTGWDNEDYTTCYFNASDKIYGFSGIMSNYFKSGTDYHANVYDNQITGNYGNNYIYIKIAKTIATSKTELNNWLNTLSTPVEIIYQLASTTEESVELPEILLNKGTNVISVDTTITPSNIWVKYKGKE